jgi:hypothetical protein
MMARHPGILSIFNNVAQGRDGDFNHWFQSEHLAERLDVPGFLVGRRYQAIEADRQYFNYYLTESAAVLTSPTYLVRVNDPTPMTRMVMSEVFRNMIRTVCERVFAAGDVRGNAAIVARFVEPPDYPLMQSTVAELLADKSAVWGEIWTAVRTAVPISEEERLRGGDDRMAACLLMETARIAEAAHVLQLIKDRFPQAAAGVYKLLAELKRVENI